MVDLFRSELLARHGFARHGFTKRAGGASEGAFASLNLAHDTGDDPSRVAENLDILRLAHGAGLPLARVRQVHGDRIASAAESLVGTFACWDAPAAVEADGIVAGDAEAILAVQTADCAPVLLADPGTGLVAALHAGWRGAARGVIREGVRALAARGASPSQLVAAIGPCICGRCYEVGAEVARCFPESSDPLPDKPGKHLLDLASAIEVSLIGAGLSSRSIDRIDACTACLERDLYSHRRAAGGPTGRHLGFIAWTRRT